MKLSTKGRYGIHAMYELAVCWENAGEQGATPQCIKQIAERQNIPEAYLEQIFGQLRRENLVTSIRGAGGGYVLSRPPEEITVGQVLRTLEGGLAVVECLLEEDSCGKSCDCPTRVVWKKLRDGINQIVDGISLKDMILENEHACAQGEE